MFKAPSSNTENNLPPGDSSVKLLINGECIAFPESETALESKYSVLIENGKENKKKQPVFT